MIIRIELGALVIKMKRVFNKASVRYEYVSFSTQIWSTSVQDINIPLIKQY